jgi:hypothetical protein
VVQAEPVEHVLVFLMTGIGEDPDQPRIARPAPGVLRRAGALARDAQRVTHARLGDGGFLDGDLVFPVVAEVVGVQEAVPWLRCADAKPCMSPGQGERCWHNRLSVEQAALGGDLRAEFSAPRSDGGVGIVGGQGLRAIVLAPCGQSFQRRLAWRLVAPP